MFVGAMAAIELLLGVNLLLGIRRKLTTIFTAIFMLVMTGITLYVFLYNPVPDCGCFGSALKLSNSETLLKNVVLLAASVFLSARPQYILRLISERNQWITAVCSLVYVVSVTVYSFRHLPVISFTPYNVWDKHQRSGLWRECARWSSNGIGQYIYIYSQGRRCDIRATF